MRRTRSPQQEKGQATKGGKSFSVINLDAAGIDLGSETHWVARYVAPLIDHPRHLFLTDIYFPSISRTFAAKTFNENGFGMKCTPSSRIP